MDAFVKFTFMITCFGITITLQIYGEIEKVVLILK